MNVGILEVVIPNGFCRRNLLLPANGGFLGTRVARNDKYGEIISGWLKAAVIRVRVD